MDMNDCLSYEHCKEPRANGKAETYELIACASVCNLKRKKKPHKSTFVW